jgi:hypothetical protein
MHERPDDLETVRLILARRRDLGEPFDRAWEMALGAVPPIVGGPRRERVNHRNLALSALAATRDAWEAAFNREPPPPPQYPERPDLAAAMLRAARAGVAVAA